MKTKSLDGLSQVIIHNILTLPRWTLIVNHTNKASKIKQRLLECKYIPHSSISSFLENHESLDSKNAAGHLIILNAPINKNQLNLLEDKLYDLTSNVVIFLTPNNYDLWMNNCKFWNKERLFEYQNDTLNFYII